MTVCALISVCLLFSVGCSAPSIPDSSGDAPEPTVSAPQPSDWQRYADTDADSSVDSYEVGADYIRIRFTDGSIYLYTYASAGEANINQMKTLAKAGSGLNSFIMNNVKYEYESKQR